MARKHTLFNFNYFKFVVVFLMAHNIGYLHQCFMNTWQQCVFYGGGCIYIYTLLGGGSLFCSLIPLLIFDQLVRVEGLNYNSAFVCFSFQPYHFLVSCILRLFCLKCVYLGLLCLPGRLILLSFTVSLFVSSKIFPPTLKSTLSDFSFLPF